MESQTKAGLFAAVLDPSVGSWMVVPAEEGRLRATLADDLNNAEVEPVQLAAGALDGLRFDWPDTPGPNHVLAIAWYDADADGALDLVAAGSGEAARVMSWREVADRYYLTELNWVPELRQAAGRAETALGVARHLDDDMQSGWSAALAERTETPLE